MNHSLGPLELVYRKSEAGAGPEHRMEVPLVYGAAFPPGTMKIDQNAYKSVVDGIAREKFIL